MRERARKWIASNASQWVAGYDKRQFEEVLADFAASECALVKEECAKIADKVECICGDDSDDLEHYSDCLKPAGIEIATAIRALAEEK